MITAKSALCGHPDCDPYRSRNSVLDERGDVVIYHACDGTRHVFRNNVHHGLVLRSRRLDREDGTTAAVLEHDGDRRWLARSPGGRVLVRHDTYYGLIAKAARIFLKPSNGDT